MGNTLSSLATDADGWPAPAESPLPWQLPRYNTKILDVGRICSNGDGACIWHVQGGRLRFPIPFGYKAEAEIFDEKVHLSVESKEGKCEFRLVVASTGHIYTGATPTAPLAKWALSLGQLEVPSGLEVFGFTHTRIISMLRHLAINSTSPTGKPILDALVAQLEPGTAVGAWAKPDIISVSTPTSAGGGGAISIAEHIQKEAQRVAHPQPAPSLAPSLHNWLSVGTPTDQGQKTSSRALKRPATQPPSSLPTIPPTKEVEPSTVTPISTPFGSPQVQQQPLGLPPRPASRAPSSFAPIASPEAHAAALVNRPASRSRSGAMSSGRGWTAFTAFGLQTRDAIREANPYASASEIEKMVGTQWSSLTAEAKQHYADVAAEVRRSSGTLGAVGSAELRANDLVVTTGVGAASEIQQQQQQQDQNEAKVLHARTRSDTAAAAAATLPEERQLRPSRRPKFFGPEFDTSDAPLPGRKSSVWETEVDRVHADILAVEEEERVAAERAAAKAAKAAKAAQRRGAKKAKDAAVEADVLDVLSSMRAEVLASETKESVEKSVGEEDEAFPTAAAAAAAAAPAESEKKVNDKSGNGNGQEAWSAHIEQ
jgi:hypothetical protein